MLCRQTEPVDTDMQALDITDTATIDETVALARQMHAASPSFRHMTFDGAQLAEFIRHLSSNPAGYARHVMLDGRFAGGLLGAATPSFFGPDMVASDMGFYVAPWARGTTASTVLIQDFRQWAARLACKRITFCNSAALNDVPYRKALEREGFIFSGSVMYWLGD